MWGPAALRHPEVRLPGTHNFHSAYEICKGPRHFGGVLTDEKGSPWMEVEQGPIVYVQWGTASEYSNYDSTNRTVVDCSQRAYKHILVDPRMSPLGKEADLWLPIRVGTDLCHVAWLAEVDRRQRRLRQELREALVQRPVPLQP